VKHRAPTARFRIRLAIAMRGWFKSPDNWGSLVLNLLVLGAVIISALLYAPITTFHYHLYP